MSVDWRQLAAEASMHVDQTRIEITFGDLARAQDIFVDDGFEDSIRLSSVVARPSALPDPDVAVTSAWVRNRLSELVGFTIDRYGRMIGEAWVPKDGLTYDEFAFYVMLLARGCDRFEYLLTGKDIS